MRSSEKKAISSHAELLLAKSNEQDEDALKGSLGEAKGCEEKAGWGKRKFGHCRRRKAGSSGNGK